MANKGLLNNKKCKNKHKDEKMRCWLFSRLWCVLHPVLGFILIHLPTHFLLHFMYLTVCVSILYVGLNLINTELKKTCAHVIAGSGPVNALVT